MNGLALCSGIAGLDLALQRVVPGYRTVCHVEGEAFAAAVLARRMEDHQLEPAPIHGDLTTFDGRPWRGVVDLVSAGYPCQPFSVAGKRRGADDERHLWPHVARVIRDSGPSFVFLENVHGHVRLGLDAVLGDLADLGFDAEWCVLGASDVGAPHRRKRLFVLAYRDGAELRLQPGRLCGTGGADQAQSGQHGEEVADRGQWPPPPDDLQAWARVPTDSQPSICGVAHRLPHRLDRLRGLGNGVVPLAAAHAFRTLAARALAPS